jgi:hypothetical protein
MLEVFSWSHRNDILHLTLILPDGSRSFIPSTWTNLNETCPQKSLPFNNRPQTDLIATTSTLLHVREIVDALLGNIRSSMHKSKNAGKKENNHAETNEPLAHTGRASPKPGHLENSRPPTTKTGHNHTRQPDQKNRLSGTTKAGQGE